MNRLHSTGRFHVTLQLLWKSHRSLFVSSGRNHQWFLAVLLCRAIVALRSCSNSPAPLDWIHRILHSFRHFGIQQFCDECLDTSFRDLQSSDIELFCTSSFPNMTMFITKHPCKKCFSWIRVSWIWRWCISTLQVAISETPKWSLSRLIPSLLVTKGCDHNLMHKALSRSCISLFLRWRFPSLQVTIAETPRWSRINNQDQTLIWRLRSNLDLMAKIKPCSFEFPISDMMIFRHVYYGPNGSDLVMNSSLHRPSSCLINGPHSLVIWWSRSFREFTYRNFDIPVVNVFDVSNSRSAKLWKGVNLLTSHVSSTCHVSPWFVIYMCLKCWISLTLFITWLCHMFLANMVCWRESDRWSRSYLDLTAVIKSLYHISRFQDSWC